MHTYAIIGIVLTVAVFNYFYQVSRNPTSKVPGPWYTKYTSLVLKYHWLTGHRAFYVHELHRKYGRAVRLAPHEVDFCDVSVLKDLFNIKERFVKAPWYRQLAGSPDETIFDTTDVAVHKKLRRALGGPMSETSLKTAVPVVEARVDLAIEKMRAEMQDKGSADVFKWWLFMASDIISELTFGESFQLLEQGKINGFVKDIRNVGFLGAVRTTFPNLDVLSRILPLPIFKNAVQSTQNLKQYAEDTLMHYKRLALSDPTRVEYGLFTKIFREEEAETMDFPSIRSNARTYIVAGSDTTSNTLTYLVWAVCQHPDIKAALLAELRTLPEGFGDAELHGLPYLAQVIDETLRLYSAAPSALPRVVPAGGWELSGHWLSAGTVVCAQAYSMHRDAEIYPEPEAFRPERWAEPTKAMKDAFIPFGGGSRVCIGLHLARMELRYAVARFFLEFPGAKVSTQEGMSDEDMLPKIFLLLTPSGKRCLIDLNEKV